MDKIAVIAGTFVDTKMGVDILTNDGFDAIGYPISNTPEEQDKLQFLGVIELENIVRQKIKDAKNKNIDKFLIYCNSLSATLDFKRISELEEVKIVTPFDAYRKIAPKLDVLMLLSANSRSTMKQEELLKSINSKIKFVSVGALPIVNLIEEKIDPRDIVNNYGLVELIEFYEKLQILGDKSIILGCTHFPYIKEALREVVEDIEIIDPKDLMISIIKGEI